MPGKVYVREGEPIRALLRRFRPEVWESGGRLPGLNLTYVKRYHRKDYYVKASEKRHLQAKLDQIKRRRAELLGPRGPNFDPQRNLV